MENKKGKSLFPKIKKKIRSFLSDESWKITKKDAFWVSAIAALSTSPMIAEAGTWWHASGWHFNWYPDTIPWAHANVWVTWWSCNHLSWLATWHLNQNWVAPWIASISGHGSHWSY
jgi:hypothetical protein